MNNLGNITNMSSDFALQATQNLRNTTNMPKVSASQDTEKVKKAAQEFEAFFITQSLEQMFAGVKTDGPFGGGNAEKIWRSFLFDEYGKEIARSGGIGISDEIMSYMLKEQEQRQAQKNETTNAAGAAEEQAQALASAAILSEGE